MNNELYTVDWRKLAGWLIPPDLRRPRMMALVNSLVSSVNDLHTRTLYLRDALFYRIEITPQVVHLERALNDRFDHTNRRIRVEDGIEYNALPLYTKAESKPLRLFRPSDGRPVSLYTKSETRQFSADFVVVIPRLLQFDPREVTAFVNGFKLATMTFKIRVV